MPEEKFDVLVVGAGPAGSICAYVLAKAGLSVVLLERGDYPGAKNVMGGIFYRHHLDEIIPRFYKEAPLERPIVEQRLWITSADSAVTFSYKSATFAQEPYNCFSVLRAKFDPWLAKKAEEAGAFLVNETVVEDVIKKDGKIIGLKTGRPDGDLYADVIIAADGVNSLLAKKAGFHPELAPQNVALGVKEIIALSSEVIESRFNVEKGQGATIELAGEITKGMDGIGFIYTNKDSVSIGLGATCADFVKTGIRPFELLEEMKSHPLIKPLIAGGQTAEYMSHLLPEGGLKAVPPLYTDGMLVIGDAAHLFNKMHREGSNLAITSGCLAAKTIISAKEKNDYSSKSLSLYKKLLEESYLIKDLKKYQKVPEYFRKHHHLFSLYPELANFALKEILTVDGKTKKEKQKLIMKKTLEKRSIFGYVSDLWGGWKAFW